MSPAPLGSYDRQKLDHLMGLALLYPRLGEELLNGRRQSPIVKQLGLSRDALSWFGTLEATTLPELAQAILSRY